MKCHIQLGTTDIGRIRVNFTGDTLINPPNLPYLMQAAVTNNPTRTSSTGGLLSKRLLLLYGLESMAIFLQSLQSVDSF